MFDSEITVNDLIKQLKSEADVYPSIPDDVYISCLNSIEQILYSDIIKEQKVYTTSPDSETTEISVDLAGIADDLSQAQVRFEDIHTVYADNRQLIKSTLTAAQVFDDVWYKDGDNIGIKLSESCSTLKIVYFIRPALKSANKEDTVEDTVKVPPEFIDLIKAKLRGEAYKLANEDELAAKWLNDYNIMLENFKSWVSTRSPGFGQ